MADGFPRRSGQEGQLSFRGRILESLRRGSTGDGAHEQSHQGASSTLAVSGRRTQEQGVSTQRPGRLPSVVTCETCRQTLSVRSAVQCSGCDSGTHAGCQTQGDILCFICTNHVTHLRRIARAFEQRIFRTWREDEWFQTVLESSRTGSALSETDNQALIVLQNYLLNSLRNELYVWEDPPLDPPPDPPQGAIPPPRTPTEEAGPSPSDLLGVPVQQTRRPPGLPTPRAEVNAPQELMQQEAAINQGQDTGGMEANAGVDQRAEGEDMGDVASNLLVGRSSSSADKTTRFTNSVCRS